MIKYEEILIPPAKAAKIVEKWRMDEDLSLASLHKTVKYSYDVVYNVFDGKNKDTSLERMSRISLALGHNLEEFCEEAFDGNEKLLQELFPSRKKLREIQAISCESKDENLSIQQADEQINENHFHVNHTHEHSATEIEIELFDRFTKMRDEHEHKMEEEHKIQIAELKENARAIEAYETNKYNEMKAMYERIIAKQEEIIAAQSKKITRLAGALASEVD